jgi:NAD+ diphosphatase
MIGFTARAMEDTLDVDGDELEDVRWFSREQLDEEVAAGNVILPPDIALAHHLIDGWYRKERDSGIEGRHWPTTAEDDRE